jgi:glycerol-3-phosphate dehydrogenase (NAD(P)+)
MSEIIRAELPEVPYGVLSGPNLAKKLWQVCHQEQ